MGLFDLVQQQDAMGVLIDTIGEQAALIIPDIAGGCTDQAADCMALHIFGHVEAQHLDTEYGGKLFGGLSLADPGWPCEKIRTDRLVRLAQAGARHLDRRGERVQRLVLAEHHPLEIRVQRFEPVGIVLCDLFGGDARDLGNDRFDILYANGLPALALGLEPLAGARLINHVDRLVGQLAIGQVPIRKLDSGLDGLVGIAKSVELLEFRLQALQDFDGIGHRRLDHVDLAEPAA